MKRTICIALLLLCCFGGGCAAWREGQSRVTEEPFHLYLLAGQSNMAGRGVPGEEDTTAHPRVLVLNQEAQWVPAVDPLHFDKPNIVGVGPGLAFAKAMADADEDVTIGLVPCAVGGSPISVWRPGAFYKATGAHPYDDALERCRVAMERGVFKGVLWHQGESDSNATDGPLYAERLTELIARLRGELDQPDLLFVAGTPADAFVERTPEVHLVIDAIKAVAEGDEHVLWVSGAGLGCKADRVHFDTAAARELGRRYAQAIMTKQNVETPRP
jgi:hypothetical protein